MQHRAGDRRVVELDPSRALRSSRPPRDMSPRPTKSIGNRSRSPNSPSSTSTYFGEATLPSSTTSQSVRSRAAACARCARAAAGSARSRRRCRPTRTRATRVRDIGIRTPQPGVRRNHVHAAADDSVARLGRRCETLRVGHFAAEIQSADEREDVAERRARARAKLLGQRERRVRRQHLPRAACRRNWRATGGRLWTMT